MASNLNLVFECTDRFSSKHSLIKCFSAESDSYADKIEMLSQFQQSINDVMTKIVDLEKAESKDKNTKSSMTKSDDDENYGSDESEESTSTSQADQADTKKIKLDK